MKALISVADKTGIIELAQFLCSKSVEIISTGGTYDLLKKSNIPVTHISNITSYKKPIDSVIKKLYPEIYAGISASRNDSKQMKQLNNLKIYPIDIVVANLFPFEQLYKDTKKSLDDCLNFIDIGGPTMLRSAAKNYKDIIVISDPSDYSQIIKEFQMKNSISINTRKYLMKKVFKTTANYDMMISEFINKYL